MEKQGGLGGSESCKNVKRARSPLHHIGEFSSLLSVRGQVYSADGGTLPRLRDEKRVKRASWA
jgi:hypothetical protein